MEKEQAIDLLDNLIGMIEDNQDNDYDTAFRMAIEALKAQLSKEGATKDTISRQVAIDAVRASYDEILDFKSTGRTVADSVEDILTALPSAQPEPQEGHWIKHIDPSDGEQYECSECGVLWEFNDGTPEDNEAYYCPKCGTKMKGEQNERFD